MERGEIKAERERVRERAEEKEGREVLLQPRALVSNPDFG